MSRLRASIALASLALLLAVPSPAAAVITVLGTVSAGSVAVNADTVTTAAVDTTGASLITCTVSSGDGASVVLTDNLGNTPTARTAHTQSGTIYEQLYDFIAPTTSASHTFTVTSATFRYPAIVCLWASGTMLSDPLDQQTGTQTSGAVTSLAGGSVTPSANNELIVTGNAFNLNQSSTPPTVSGYTVAWIDQAGSNYGAALAYVVQGTLSATNPTWTFSTATSMGIGVITEQVASGVVAATPRLMLLGAP